MQITLQNIGKRYKNEWIFKGINHEFSSDNSFVILGSNGSGKSTLLQIIASSLSPTEGTLSYFTEKNLPADNLQPTSDNIFQRLTYAAPYMELIEEYTLSELIGFHSQFKSYLNGLEKEEIPSLMQLEKSKDKQLKYFSSGMRQRVRLALAILSDSSLVLLDEPCSNLDQKAIDWYQQLIQQFKKDRLIIVCSNHQKHEYTFCDSEFSLENYR